jgi:hypothetical protein
MGLLCDCKKDINDLFKAVSIINDTIEKINIVMVKLIEDKNKE